MKYFVSKGGTSYHKVLFDNFIQDIRLENPELEITYEYKHLVADYEVLETAIYLENNKIVFCGLSDKYYAAKADIRRFIKHYKAIREGLINLVHY